MSPQTLNALSHPEQLATMAHRDHNAYRDGYSNKVMVDVSRVDYEDLTRQHCHTIHNANLKACGRERIAFAAGQDYSSSLFRVQHYLGSLQTYMERPGDYRGQRDEAGYEARRRTFVSKETQDDDDIRPWLNQFVEKVGPEMSQRLLE